MWTKNPQHACLIALATLSLGAAEAASAQIVGRTLALGRQTGTLALSDLKGSVCRSAPAPCPTCETPETFLPIDPHLDLMRIPDDDGAGGNGREFPATFWHVVGMQTANGHRTVQIRPYASCDKTTLVTECGTFDVKLFWNGADSVSQGRLWLLDDDGLLFGDLALDLQLVATPRGRGDAFAIHRQLRFQLHGTWSATPGSDVYTSGPIHIDSDCDGVQDLVAQPTATGLFLGWQQNGEVGAVCGLGAGHSADFCWAPARDEADGQLF
jgi:hypothetical protein